MHTSFSLWPQPYFPSFGLKKTNKPIFKFSEKCFPSSWFLNAFKWKKRTENRLLFGWFASSLKLLFFCFRDSVIDSTFSQIVKQLALARMMPFKIAQSSFFFLNVSYYWMQTRINFSWLMVFHSYSVPAEFMNFANNNHSPFFFFLPPLVSQEFQFFMLLALPHVWFILIRADQLVNLEHKQTLCRWAPVVIVGDWCIGLELRFQHSPFCPLPVFVVGGACLIYCRMFRSIPGFYLLVLHDWQAKMPSEIAKCSLKSEGIFPS